MSAVFSVLNLLELSLFTDIATNKLLSLLLGNITSNAGSTVNLVCPKGQTVTIEVVPSVDDGYQLLLRSSDLPTVLAVRRALLNRLEVSSSPSYLFFIVYTALLFWFQQIFVLVV